MNKQKKDLWFGVYGKPYVGDEPAFFDDDLVPGAALIKAAYPAIKQELMPLMQPDNAQLQPYFDESLQFPPKGWKSITFYFWGIKSRWASGRFPVISQLVRSVPGCVSASLSLLEAGAEIRPHTGETNAIFRVHLGLSIPGQLPSCGFTVKDEMRAWQEGGLLTFLDAYCHSAKNHTDQPRYILILDIMRPEFRRDTRRVCVQSLSTLSLLFVISKLPDWLLSRLAGKGQGGGVPKWCYDLALFPFKLVGHVVFPFIKK